MIDERPFVLIDDARPNVDVGDGTLLFSNPVQVLCCEVAEHVPETFAKIERALTEGYHVAGYMAYELGYALEPKLTRLMPKVMDTPLIWMGVYDAPSAVSTKDFTVWEQYGHRVGALRAALEREAYIEQVERIRDHIRRGDVYQINHTFPQHFDFSGSPLSLYSRLRRTQRARYGGVVADGTRHIVSLSPELFFETHGTLVRTRPMKGTAARAADPSRDDACKTWLQHDEKSQAENLMIVDLLRNDLARLALVGSVNVTDLFSVETYPTLHQLTSGIEAKLRPGIGFGDIARALFPCGSVTGAPKIKAMELIRDLEPYPRGAYTGAVGHIAPNGDARFNVAIRTLQIQGNMGVMGIGSGIVYDSDPAAEWEECHLKARFLTTPTEPFALLETILWEPERGFVLLERHLQRLERSAAYFVYPFNRETAIQALNDAVATPCDDNLRLRLLVDADGNVTVKAAPLIPLSVDGRLRYAFASEPIETDTPFVFHKTTNRAFYDDERTRQNTTMGCDEVLFVNTKGELTEGSFTNIFVERDGLLLTPALSCGVLNGTLRQDLIDTGRAQEAVLTPTDLDHADQVWLGNSVRGLMHGIPVQNTGVTRDTA